MVYELCYSVHMNGIIVNALVLQTHQKVNGIVLSVLLQ